MKKMPVVLYVVDEKLKLVATLVVVVETEVVVVAELVVVLKVVMVVARVTPRKLDAKSRLSPTGQTSSGAGTEQPWTEIK